jgi:prolyl-tRNA synthetase
VPVRLELGPRDLDADRVTLVPRLTGEREEVPLPKVGDRVREALDATQRGLFDQARDFRDAHTFRPKDMAEMAELLEEPGGFMLTGWCGSEECEARVKAETKATLRFLPIEPQAPDAPCIVCGRPAVDEAAWALAY